MPRRKLSEPQLRVLRHACNSMRPLGGHAIKTAESLAKRGLITWHARLECVVCTRYDCSKHRQTLWRVWVDATEAGRAKLLESTP